jgi:threonine dehydrogenase-like Zn-dependent dehydrogenase
MRAPFMGGEFPFPVKYGYANVGVVEQGPEELIGKTVFCLFPHQTQYVVPASAVSVVPREVRPRRAVLTANMETAINGVWDGGVGPGDRVAVIGAGVVGCLVAHVAAQTAGVDLTLVDIDPAKAAVAKNLGLNFCGPQDVGTGFDRVFHASGQADGLRLALEIAGPEATIIELSWYGLQSVELPLGGPFHARRLRIVSSQVGTIPADRRARWSYTRRLGVATRLLRDDRLDALLTSSSAFEDLPTTMPRVTSAPGELCHVVKYAATG